MQLLLIALAAMVTSQLIGVLENYINAWISQRIVYDMRNQMYDHLQHMPHSFFTTEKQGDIITRMDTDISGVSSVVSGTLSKVVSNVAAIITTLVALFTMSWKLAIVGLDIAVEELFVNVCKYAYADAEPDVPRIVRIHRTYTADPPSITVDIIDKGVAFDPLAKPDAVTPDNIMDVPIGGLGILMAKKSVNEMSYEREGGSNIVTIVKKW